MTLEKALEVVRNGGRIAVEWTMCEAGFEWGPWVDSKDGVWRYNTLCEIAILDPNELPESWVKYDWLDVTERFDEYGMPKGYMQYTFKDTVKVLSTD